MMRKRYFWFLWGGHFKCKSAKTLKDTPGWLSGMVTIWVNHGEMAIYVGLDVMWFIILSWYDLQGVCSILDGMWNNGKNAAKAL